MWDPHKLSKKTSQKEETTDFATTSTGRSIQEIG